jgi:hypothetical protein
LNRLAFLGFAIGGWTGLPEYRERLVAAQAQVRPTQVALMLVVALGGIATAFALSSPVRLRDLFPKIPLFIFLFSTAIALAVGLILLGVETFRWIKG